MKRNKYGWDEDKIQRFINENRGQGYGKEYRPWITVQDVASIGDSHRIHGWKTNRQHDLLSNLEYQFLLLLEWSDEVTDIRERFPLQRSTTLQIAEEMGVEHPKDTHTGVNLMMTSDFLITMEVDGRLRDVVRSVVPSEKLENRRALEKLEIERRYWHNQEVDWDFVTEKNLPLAMVNNLKWFHQDYYLTRDGYSSEDLTHLCDVLKSRLYQQKGLLLNDIFDGMDKEYNLDSGFTLFLFKHLLARKQIVMDLNNRIRTNESVVNILDIKLGSNKGEAIG